MSAKLSPYWLWLLLSLPALGFIGAISGSSDPEIFHELLHPTGDFSARFMIIAMLASPLVLLFKGWRGPLWLRELTQFLWERIRVFPLLVRGGISGA